MTTQRGLAVLVLAGLVSLNSPAAFGAGRVEERRGPVIERAAQVREHIRQVAEELELTAIQKALLRKIFAAEREEILDVRADDSLSRREKVEALREIRRDVFRAIHEVLTPEQWEEWLAMREDQRQSLRDRVSE